MLAISPLSSNKDENNNGGTTMAEGNFSMGTDDFPDFSGANLLDSIDFDELFMGMHDGDVLPDLEMDPELLAEFSLSSGGYDDSTSEANNSPSSGMSTENNVISPMDDASFDAAIYQGNYNNDDVVSLVLEEESMEKHDQSPGFMSNKTPEEVEIVSKNDAKSESATTMTKISSSKESHKGKKSKSGANNNNHHHGKRKTKVTN